MKLPKSFCPLPWLHSYVGIEGHYQVCCIGDEYNNKIVNDEGKAIHITDELSPSEIMNTDYMKKFRLQLLKGELPSECTRCRVVEKMGGSSRRQNEIDQYSALNAKLIEGTEEDGTIQAEIKHADYRLGNTCNLQCRMCGPLASSKWIKDYQALPDNLRNVRSDPRIEVFKKINWHLSDLPLREFNSKMIGLTRLHFAGGEAFYVKNMEKILQHCIDHDIAGNITLSYNTNLTLLGESLLEKWKQFKEVKLLISVDGYGELNEYIRYPSKWGDVDRHLKYLDEHHQDYNITEIMLSTTVQINNVLHLQDLYQYLESFKFIFPLPNLIMLHAPNYLNVAALPTPLKLLAALKLSEMHKKLKDQFPEHLNYLIENLKAIQNEIRASLKIDPKRQRASFQRFQQYSDIFDKKRNLNLLKVNPEMKKFLQKDSE